MDRIERIEDEVRSLSNEELAAFRGWFREFDAEVWEREIEADILAGKLDALTNNALNDHRAQVHVSLKHFASQEESIGWQRNDDLLHPYVTDFDGEKGIIRLNDFPEEHLYTLIVDDVEIADFSDWPEQWVRP